MLTNNQDDFKIRVKTWLKANHLTYRWLASKCYVTEATIRNWMAKKSIPRAKEYIISELIGDGLHKFIAPLHAEEETVIKFRLDEETRVILEKKATRKGMTLSEYLVAKVTVPDDDEDAEEIKIREEH